LPSGAQVRREASHEHHAAWKELVSATRTPAAALPDTIRFVERDWLSSNQVFFVDGDEATVVDTGYVKHAPMTVAIVRRLLAETGARLARIVNTHLHSDHCGGNASLVQAFGCRVFVPAASLEDVANWDEEALTHAATGQRCDRFTADGTLSPGARLTMGGLPWRVLAAPGHDPKSLIFHCAQERLLISADALWEQGFGVIFPELEGESGFAEQQAVLELISSLPVDTVLPGHGPAFNDLNDALERAFALLRRLRSEPTRLPRHAVKVLTKYLMLDLERTENERLVARLAGTSVLRTAASLLGMAPEAALSRAIDELVAQDQLIREGNWLVNPGSP
jgi:glyoxylase-like metal-dependent hydrolase (beta-lactamase superfamily II)